MNIKGFVNSLSIMGMGMLGIFVVIGIIYAVVAVLNGVTGKKEKDS